MGALINEAEHQLEFLQQREAWIIYNGISKPLLGASHRWLVTGRKGKCANMGEKTRVALVRERRGFVWVNCKARVGVKLFGLQIDNSGRGVAADQSVQPREARAGDDQGVARQNNADLLPIVFDLLIPCSSSTERLRGRRFVEELNRDFSGRKMIAHCLRQFADNMDQALKARAIWPIDQIDVRKAGDWMSTNRKWMYVDDYP